MRVAFTVCICFIVCQEEEEQEQEGEESLLSTEHFIADVAHGPGNSLLSTFHTVIIKDESGSILETGDGADPLKEEEGDGNYCMVQVSGSPPSHPAALNCQLNYATMCGPLPTFFGDMNSVPRASGAEFTQEIPAQSQERAEGCYPDSTEKETKKQKISGSSGMCSPKTSSVAPGDLYSLTQLQDVNLNLGHATRRSARCAAASTAGRQSYRMSSFQESAGSQDVAKEKKVPPENPEEQGALPPVRKKTRTFYSAGRSWKILGATWQIMACADEDTSVTEGTLRSTGVKLGDTGLHWLLAFSTVSSGLLNDQEHLPVN